MKYSKEEQEIINEKPDFENQVRILEEEHKENKKKKRFVFFCIGIIICIITIVYVSYSWVYVYKPYNPVNNDKCLEVNKKILDSKVPLLNITEGNNCKPVYNIDYFLNGRPMFNIDLFGDKSKIFNQMNQKDASGKYCVLNCDADNDGWPDYNIDLNGDGKADINIINNPENKQTGCDLNCDINYDTIPDTNIDTDGDGKPDVNIAGEDYRKPLYNIDYMGNKKATFNIKNASGGVDNPVTNALENKKCTKNCDIDNDGWPDYNISINGSNLINELISSSGEDMYYYNYHSSDWKCLISPSLFHCRTSVTIPKNSYINIDVNGDGTPDVNLSTNGGKKITNELNKKVNIKGKKVTLNYDADGDGFPDFDIDINNDNIPDLNISDPNSTSHACTKNCDMNGDGKEDYQIVIGNNENMKYTIFNINQDIDYDGKCDVNCDSDNDLYPDYNIDTNGDNIPDINISFLNDGIINFNIDTNNDGLPDKNIDAYGLGKCTFNCDGENKNPVGKGNSCTKNCDTNGDGLPDKNVDINGDGTCDFNCNGNRDTQDKDNNYFIDSSYNDNAILNIKDDEQAVYVINPIDIKADEIEPGWEDKYVLTIKNHSNYAIKYKLYWSNVRNEYTVYNLDYYMTRSNLNYISETKTPYSDLTLEKEIIIKDNSTVKYVLNLGFKETGTVQNVDSGKTFYGQLKLDVIK